MTIRTVNFCENLKNYTYLAEYLNLIAAIGFENVDGETSV